MRYGGTLNVMFIFSAQSQSVPEYHLSGNNKMTLIEAIHNMFLFFFSFYLLFNTRLTHFWTK